MKRIAFAFLVPAIHAFASSHPPGTVVRVFNDSWAQARVVGHEVTGKIFLPKNLVLVVTAVSERVGIETLSFETTLEDPEHICVSDGRVKVAGEISEERVTIDAGRLEYEAEMRKTLAPLRGLIPERDFVRLVPNDAVYDHVAFFGPGEGAHRHLLARACGDPNRIRDEDRKTTEVFTKDMSERRSSISAEYPVLAELKDQLDQLRISNVQDYERALKEHPAPLLYARRLLRNLVETSDITQPPFENQRLLRETFGSPLSQQLILEEAGRQMLLAYVDESKRSCARVVRALHLLEHVDSDYAPLGLEPANSVMFLYNVYDGTWYDTCPCSQEIARSFQVGYGIYRPNSSSGELPYGLQVAVNLSVAHQREVQYSFMGIPYRTVREYENEWGADVPGVGRILREYGRRDHKNETHWHWKKFANEDVAKKSVKDSRALLKLWSKRASE